MAFVNESGVTALWGKCKAWFARTVSISGATVTLKNNAGDILSQATIPDATTSTAGLMSAQDKARVDGLVASGGEPNQNAFAKVAAGGSTVEADLVSDTLVIAAGGNVTVSADASTDTVTISATDTTYSAATSSSGGLMTPAMVAKLDGVEAGANKTVADASLSAASSNPVQNKAVQAALSALEDKVDARPTVTAMNEAIAAAQVGAAMYQGAAATNSDISGSSYRKGWYWVVSTPGTFVGQACEAGDMVFANSDKGSAYSASHFDVVQANIQAMTAAEVEAICV